MTPRLLILGGTTEARLLASALFARGGYAVTLSLAGRTERPVPHAVPLRVGGFGGSEGLAEYLRKEAVHCLVDATHPHATRISPNAIAAATDAQVPLVILRRAPWVRHTSDHWIEVADMTTACIALGATPRRVFVAVGRSGLESLLTAPQHDYLIRSVEPVEPPLALPRARYILDRGPFGDAAEHALLADNGIDLIIAKNSGGDAAYGKIAAARALGIVVVMIGPPARPPGHAVTTIDEALSMIDHALTLATKRGV